MGPTDTARVALGGLLGLASQAPAPAGRVPCKTTSTTRSFGRPPASLLKGLKTELTPQAASEGSAKGGKAVQRVTVSLACLVAGIAFGQDVCGDDVQKFCANITPGAGRVERCLEEHQAQLSPTCQGHVETDKLKLKAGLAEFWEACRGDVGQLCPGVASGGGRLLKCLSKNDYALSRSCLAEVTKVDTAREQVATLKRLCEPDAKRLCPGATGHAGELFACLKSKEAQLSEECKSANPSVAVESATLMDLVEEVTSQARIEDTIEILQGLNSVAFSRNQVAIQFDYLQGLARKPVNADELTFNPLFVFGPKNEFAVSAQGARGRPVPQRRRHPQSSGRLWNC